MTDDKDKGNGGGGIGVPKVKKQEHIVASNKARHEQEEKKTKPEKNR